MAQIRRVVDPRRSSVPSLALVGFMASGKSRVGREVAARLDTPYVDTDALIEAEHGPIAEIFAASGEPAFRHIERDVVVGALKQACEAPAVVALGGGAVMDGDVREALSRIAHVAWLTAPEEVLWGRVMQGVRETRPLAASHDAFVSLLREREAVYAEVATVTMQNDGSRPLENVVAGLVASVRGDRDRGDVADDEAKADTRGDESGVGG